jgi:tetratricopeptide (TPR) repeat protein
VAKRPNVPRQSSPAQSSAKRVEKELAQGHTSAAADLARQLVRQSATPENLALRRKATLAHADHLNAKESFTDARSLLNEAVSWADNDPVWVEHLAERYAAAGAVQKALELLGKVPGSTALPRVLARAADTALRVGGDRGKGLLTPELQAGYDAVRTAFTHYEAGRDAEATGAIGTIGLRSPFAEWKLLLRGLTAYSAGDDARAVENWQRLDAGRLPARLAAPYRQAIDRVYRDAMSPAARAAVQAQADQLLGGGLIKSLRDIQAYLAREGGMTPAVRQAEAILPTLKRDHPDLVGRLANCFYWAIVSTGDVPDVPRYQRLFGAPPDDPQLARLQALLSEQFADCPEAHRHWQMLELGIKSKPERWPGGQANRARAMIWLRLGRNDERHLEEPEEDYFDDIFYGPRSRRGGKRVPLKPPAAECYRRALELAPDWVEPYRVLFEYHRAAGQPAKAEQIAGQLRERFADELPALEVLADFYLERGKPGEALDLIRKAAHQNPLDRRLRAWAGAVLLTRAADHAASAKFDAARADFAEALNAPEIDRLSVLCAWSTTERKAGDAARADELAAQASGSKLGTAYRLMVETARQRAGQNEKVRANKAFADALAAPIEGAAVADLLGAMRAYQLQKADYHGRKTHEKKAMDVAGKAVKAKPDEAAMEKIGKALAEQRWFKLMRECAEQGRRRFPKNPYFPFLYAESMLLREGDYAPPYRVVPALNKAKELAEASARPDRQELLDAIAERMRPFSMWERMFRGWGDADEEGEP